MILHQERRVVFGVAADVVACGAGVLVDHEAGNGALQTRQRTFQKHEARARHLSRRLEVHQAQRFAQLEVLLGREVELLRLAPATDLPVVRLVLAVDDVGQRQVGDHRERVVQGSDELALLFFGALQELLQLGHFRLQLVGRGRVLGAHRLADLLGGGVAAALGLLQPGLVAAAGIVQLDQPG